MNYVILIAIGLIGVAAPLALQKSQGTGFFKKYKIENDLDSKIANYYFQKLSGDYMLNAELEGLIKEATSRLSSNPINNEDMAQLSKDLSTDFATLYLLNELLKNDRNKNAQDLYHLYDVPAHQIDQDKRDTFIDQAGEYVFVFVPGLFYLRHPENGGDFAKQRSQLDAMGLQTHFIETKETGLVEENANIIADEIKELTRLNKKVILVSASKGGPELAFALGNILSHEETKNVKVWISVGGVLRGSPVADNYLSGFKRWWARTLLFFIGENMDFVEDISHKKGVERYKSLVFPEDLIIIHFIGAPLSTQLNKEVEKNYKQLRELGPNDGLTTLVDELTPQGIAIAELGLDHYYRHEQIDRKTISLIYVAMELIEQQNEQN